MDLSTQINSCLYITSVMTIAITSLTIALSIIYFAGSYLGYPFAQFILRFTQPTQYQHIGSQSQYGQADVNPKEHELARLLGAMLAMCLCFMAYVLETVFEGVRGESSGLDPWRMEERLFRVCLEGLLILAIMRGIRRAVLFVLG